MLKIPYTNHDSSKSKTKLFHNSQLPLQNSPYTLNILHNYYTFQQSSNDFYEKFLTMKKKKYIIKKKKIKKNFFDEIKINCFSNQLSKRKIIFFKILKLIFFKILKLIFFIFLLY
jgi:hypothetical protein